MALSMKEELIARKRLKQLSRSLLPDAPPRKRAQKQQSPERTECLLELGTPSTPPVPRKQPWQLRMPSPLPEVPSGCSPTSSLRSSVMELEVDRTCGQLKNKYGNVTTACLVADDPITSSPSISSSTTTKPRLVKLLNKAIKGKESEERDHSLTMWLADDEQQSEDEEVDDMQPELTQAARLAPAHIFEECDTESLAYMTAEDKSSDQLMIKLLPTDHLTFDWSYDRQTFTATRQTFTGQSGPTFDMTNETRPLDIFFKFFDDELLNLITTQTNKYAAFMIDRHLTKHSRLNQYKNVDREEMYIFLAILILQGLAPMPVETNYWEDNGHLTFQYFKTIMTYNRFILLKRLLHFSDSTDSDLTRLTQDQVKLRKIQPVLDLLKNRFSTLYLPGQNIAIDESLLKWQGRLSFAQKIATKAAKLGVKSYELCESATGYLWNFFVYTGRQTNNTDETDETKTDETKTDETKTDETKTDKTDETKTDKTDEASMPIPANATAKIVHDLAKPLFNRGHTIVMDNFYNSPLLARYLKSQGTDCFGTLRINREFVPEAIKSVSKAEMRHGELVQSFCPDLHVMMWRDSNIVSMVSTYHKGTVGGKEKYGNYKYKPQIVLDYNVAMGGVDKKDQLLSAFPIERARNQVWYKKVFRRLLNITLLNSYIIYKTQHTNVTQRWFRTQVAESLIKIFKPPIVERPLQIVATKSLVGLNQKNVRPILDGNHFIGIGPSKYASCVWCKKSRTKYICKQCKVSLCLQICFEEYHTVPEPRSPQ